jgi:cob(I)alamin adenosyltransferase
MGHRLSKIYTRTGDAGETGLGDGTRVPKDSLRVHALGEVDELNSMLGLLLAEDCSTSAAKCASPGVAA